MLTLPTMCDCAAGSKSRCQFVLKARLTAAIDNVRSAQQGTKQRKRKATLHVREQFATPVPGCLQDEVLQGHACAVCLRPACEAASNYNTKIP
jgi:hypothetical protein